MSMIVLTINHRKIDIQSGTTILEAARLADIYIPTLCYHPDLPATGGSVASPAIYQGDLKVENAFPAESGQGCGLCVVEILGQEDLVCACTTAVTDGMVVETNTPRVCDQRRENLVPILSRHRHACLTCAQQAGCSGSQCSSNVPENERCCTRFGHCELQAVADYIGISDSTPKWVPTDLPQLKTDPLFERDYNLCIGCTRCVRACRDLRGIEALGFVYDSKGIAQVGTLSPTLAESGCRFCMACVEVCPTGAIVDKGVSAARKTGEIVPCRSACPAGIDVPEYIRLISLGRQDQALAVIREKVPFPGVLGRVCIRPCEQVCRRGRVNDPISICALKRYAADAGKSSGKSGISINSDSGDANFGGADSGKTVAVVGAGPAGLTAAFYLRRKGHAVTLFEASGQAGGMLRHGIPDFRLPPGVLDEEIKYIFNSGITFAPYQRLGKDFTLAQLRSEGFDAVFLGIGAQLSRRIPLEGCDLPDVLWGVDFLRDVARGKNVGLKENIVVIGGGNVAVDAAMTALRCGAVNVSLVCMETAAEMPAGEREIQGAAAEGVNILPSWGPEKIIIENGKVTGLDLVACTCVFDAHGNFCPEFDDSTRECLLVDQIILAVGQAVDLAFLDDGIPVGIENGLVVVDDESLETTIPGVYAGGDVAASAGAVIHAIAAGRRAAIAIDTALGGTGDIDETAYRSAGMNPVLGRYDGFAELERVGVRKIPLSERRGFSEIERGYDETEAMAEAGRCLQCDLRLSIGYNPSPPVHKLGFHADIIETVPETEGVFKLIGENQKVLSIKGTANLKQELLDELKDGSPAVFFEYEEDKMYTQRESELIQRHLQVHGEMPGGGDDDLDDLF
ncbi:MAG: FAD-dependent oxidoreductase [Desulfobacteraceae bacterium]|nr:FAD-dependent oxidoreductase [Desulfobacteraceae bacterium]